MRRLGIKTSKYTQRLAHVVVIGCGGNVVERDLAEFFGAVWYLPCELGTVIYTQGGWYVVTRGSVSMG